MMAAITSTGGQESAQPRSEALEPTPIETDERATTLQRSRLGSGNNKD